MRINEGMDGAVALRRWRRGEKLTRVEAASKLGVSERMLAYYESGERPAILLAARAPAAGLDADQAANLSNRERWVSLVRNLMEYGSGVPVVGRMLKSQDIQGLSDFLGFVKRGPDSSIALTDPALFRSMRAAVTRAQLAGLAHFRLAPKHPRRIGKSWPEAVDTEGYVSSAKNAAIQSAYLIAIRNDTTMQSCGPGKRASRWQPYSGLAGRAARTSLRSRDVVK